MKYNYALKSAIGGRKENQDSAGSMLTRFGFASVVCDGMGGAAGGKMASSMAVDIILHELNNARYADPAAALRSAITKANHEIYRRGRQQQELRGMGTTAIAVIINIDKAIVAHVGDSRVYQLRDGEKVFRTDDHSKVFELVKRGILTEEQARLSEESNIIQRALGIASEVDVEINDNIPFWKGDLFMLCTDGVCGAVPEEDLLQLLTKSQDVKKLSQKVIEQIDLTGNRQGGGHDNLTVSFVQPLINSKLKVRIDMKTRIIMNILSAWVALLTVALCYIIFWGGLRTLPVTKEKTDSLATQQARLSSDLIEIRSKLDSVKLTARPSAVKAPASNDERKKVTASQSDSERLGQNAGQNVSERDSNYTVAPDYTVKEDDTMNKIAKELGVKDSQLRKFKEANRHIKWERLQKDQVLKSIKVPRES
nr:protein phosphatase 2C domain-containing protein [uncultured Dyadobacter sp.]